MHDCFGIEAACTVKCVLLHFILQQTIWQPARKSSFKALRYICSFYKDEWDERHITNYLYLFHNKYIITSRITVMFWCYQWGSRSWWSTWQWSRSREDFSATMTRYATLTERTLFPWACVWRWESSYQLAPWVSWVGGELKFIFQPLNVISRLQVGLSGVCRYGELIWTCLVWAERSAPRQFLGAKPPTQFLHRWAERNNSDHYTNSEPASSLVPNWEAQTSQFYVFGLTGPGIEPRPPAPWAEALTTRLRGPVSMGVRLLLNPIPNIYIYI